MKRNPRFKSYYLMGKYETDFSGFLVSFVFITVAILSSFMVMLNYRDSFVKLETWGYWMFIPGFFMLLGSFGKLNNNKKYVKAVKNALLDRSNIGKFKLEDLSLEIGIRPKIVVKILVDLRNKELLSYRFDLQSGEIYLGKNIINSQSNGFLPPLKTFNEPLPQGKAYCQYCGHIIETGDIFCKHCGSKF